MIIEYLLSDGSDNSLEGIFPGIHLDDSDSSDYLIHDTNTFICELSRLQPCIVKKE